MGIIEFRLTPFPAAGLRMPSPQREHRIGQALDAKQLLADKFQRRSF
jgi:hypothetical protein